MKTAWSPGAASPRPRPGARSGTVPLKRQPDDPSDYVCRLQSRPSRIHRQRALNDRAIKGLFFSYAVNYSPSRDSFSSSLSFHERRFLERPGQMRSRYAASRGAGKQ